MFLQKPVETLNVPQTQTETESSHVADTDEFNSFHFWREPPLSIDDGLLELLVSQTSRDGRRLHTDKPAGSQPKTSSMFVFVDGSEDEG